MSRNRQPARNTVHFLPEGKVVAGHNRLAEQADYVSRVQPDHPFFRRYLGLLQIHADSAAEVVSLNAELEVEQRARQAEKLQVKREKVGALWRMSELTMPIIAEMCLSTSEGTELTEVALDAYDALDTYVDLLDDHPKAMEFVPRPFANSDMYASIERHIGNVVEEAWEYQL